MVKIIYCKILTVLFTLTVTSIVMMEMSGQLNSQAALPLAVVHPITVGGRVGGTADLDSSQKSKSLVLDRTRT